MYFQEDQDFWEKIIDGIDKDVPKQFLSEFDTQYPFGFNPHKGRAKPQLWDVFLEGKRDHPTKLVIVKVWCERAACTGRNERSSSLHFDQ